MKLRFATCLAAFARIIALMTGPKYDGQQRSQSLIWTAKKTREIELYSVGRHCEYYLPRGLPEQERSELIRKMDEYRRNKWYKVAVRGYISNDGRRLPYLSALL